MTAARVTWRQVHDELLARIRNGHWPADTILPGEVELAAEFGCARATVNRAMQALSDAGYVERKRKAGTRVRAAPRRQARLAIPLIRDEIEATGAAYRYTLIQRDPPRAAPGWLRARLRLADGAQVLGLTCLHAAGSRPFMVEHRWISLGTVPQAASADFVQTGPNEWLVGEVPFTDIDLTFSATAAAGEAAELLDCAPGAALFTIERCTWLEGDAVTLARLQFAPGYQMTAAP